MLLREAIQSRLAAEVRQDPSSISVRLPLSLKTDRVTVRTGMCQRLASSRLFALGDRSGVLRAAQQRSGRPFRLDVRQRVIVKALVSRHMGRGLERAAALAKHLVYLRRDGAGVEGVRPAFCDRERDGVEASTETEGWSEDRHHFRFIISPEHGDRISDLKGYVRDVMGRVSADLGEPGLRWIATCHYDTDRPHAHVLVRGRRGDGRDLVIPRDYIGYGFRGRAQEVAQERLGDLSRIDAERRVWKETEAARFTGLDRRLLAAMDADRTVPDGVGGHDAWAALTRGRLRHLEGLGLARRSGRRFQLSEGMEARLKRLQASRDIIRTLNQRRLEGARGVRQLEGQAIAGEVVKSGFHDELGAIPFVIVRGKDGADYYARLAPGAIRPAMGRTVTLQRDARGFGQILSVSRDRGLGR